MKTEETRPRNVDRSEGPATLDRSVLEQLGELDATSPGLVAKLCALYADGTPTLIEAIQAAVLGKDAAAVATHAHSLKGSSLSIGAARLAGLSAQLEVEAKLGRLQSPDAWIKPLVDEFERVREALKGKLR